jgi:hypothetical protein
MQTVSREALAHAVQTVWMWRRSRRLEGSEEAGYDILIQAPGFPTVIHWNSDVIEAVDLYCKISGAEFEAVSVEIAPEKSAPPPPPPPVEVPVWDKATVKPTTDGWNIYTATGKLLATVDVCGRGDEELYDLSGEPLMWRCQIVDAGVSLYGTTAQAAIDRAREWLQQKWCL